jgi:hypothetical protein
MIATRCSPIRSITSATSSDQSLSRRLGWSSDSPSPGRSRPISRRWARRAASARRRASRRDPGWPWKYSKAGPDCSPYSTKPRRRPSSKRMTQPSTKPAERALSASVRLLRGRFARGRRGSKNARAEGADAFVVDPAQLHGEPPFTLFLHISPAIAALSRHRAIPLVRCCRSG